MGVRETPRLKRRPALDRWTGQALAAKPRSKTIAATTAATINTAIPSARREPLASDIDALHGLAMSAGVMVGW